MVTYSVTLHDGGTATTERSKTVHVKSANPVRAEVSSDSDGPWKTRRTAPPALARLETTRGPSLRTLGTGMPVGARSWRSIPTAMTRSPTSLDVDALDDGETRQRN